MIDIHSKLSDKFDNKIILFSLISIPFFLITGPFIPDLIISTITIYFVYYSIKLRDYSVIKNKYFKIFLFFLFFSILASALSDFKLYSLKTSLSYLRFGIFVVVFYIVISRQKNSLFYLWNILLFCFIILVFDGYYQFIFKKNIFGFEMQGQRLSSFFADELILGSYLSRFLPLIYSLYFLPAVKSKVKFKFLFHIIIILSIILIYLSGERAALFYIFASLIFLLITLNSHKKIILYKIVIFILSFLIFLNFNQGVRERILNQTVNEFGFKSEKVYIFSSNHEGHYLATIDLIKKNIIFGIGPKNFRKYCYSDTKYSKLPYICTSHPHNTYLQLFLETGIFGFIIVLSIFLNFCFKILKHIFSKIKYRKGRYNDFQLCLICCFFITLWPFIPSGNFFNNFLSIIYFYPVALFLYSVNLNRKE